MVREFGQCRVNTIDSDENRSDFAQKNFGSDWKTPISTDQSIKHPKINSTTKFSTMTKIDRCSVGKFFRHWSNFSALVGAFYPGSDRKPRITDRPNVKGFRILG